MTETLLIAEDDPLQRRMLTTLLTKKLGYEVIATANGEEALARLAEQPIGAINAVLLDINMPVMDGITALKILRSQRPDLPVLMLTSTDDTSIAVQTIKDGASDFIVKPPEPVHLDVAIKNAIRLSALAQELAKLKRTRVGVGAFSDMVGHSGGLLDIVAYGRKAAACDVPVLIMGETGTGKELFARTIHGESKRMGGPFVAVNCSAISQNIEQLLFGDDRSASNAKPPHANGKIRAAEGGTLFLDDISELPPEAQVRLLRVLQQREIEPTNGGKPVKVNLRIISATDRDLTREIAAGKFREDLYFRLNILPITIPALRTRPQDILPLAEYFIGQIATSDRLLPKPIAPDAAAYLMQAPWPGNVRELEGLIHRALVLCEEDTIDRALLARIHATASATTPVERRKASSPSITLQHTDGHFKTAHEIEAEALQLALAHYEQNATRAADALGIAKSTFYRKIKEVP